MGDRLDQDTDSQCLPEEYRTDQILNLHPEDGATPLERITLLARALAHGALQGYWSPEVNGAWNDRHGNSQLLRHYLTDM